MEKPWQNPKLDAVWEIEDISDSARFMQFVVDISPVGSIWIVSGIFEDDTIKTLQPFTPKKIIIRRFLGLFTVAAQEIEIRLTAENKEQLKAAVSKLDFRTEFTEHHIYHGRDEIMVSYDNLNPCWITKQVPRSGMKKASGKYGFEFSDSNVA